MTKEQFMKKLYRLQILQQMAVGVEGLTFKVDTFTLRETNDAAVEYMLLRGENYLASGTIAEVDSNESAKAKLTELNTLISKKGWI